MSRHENDFATGWSSFLSLTTCLWLFSAFLTAVIVRIRLRPGLRHVPGPFQASIAPFDRLWSAAGGLQMDHHLRLHEKYGSLVRVGPNHVSFSDASLIQQVYGITTKFYKSDFYKLFDANTPAGFLPTIFSTRDEDHHKTVKRPVANAFSMSSLRDLEPMNDECSAILIEKLDGVLGTDVDLGDWLHWYAFDVITSITFSNRMGFMEQEKDIDNIIAAIEGRLTYNTVIGQIPYLHRYLFGNQVVAKIASLIPAVAIMNSSRYIVQFAAKQLKRYENKDVSTEGLKDMLDRFKRYKDGEQVMSDSQLLSHAASNIFAGADTTAISLRAILYYLCRSPEAYTKVTDEIDEADRKGRLSNPLTFLEAQELPYFQAVVKEALRMHPAVGLLLERVVPQGGATLGGVWFPEGVVVGMNPWVAARDQEAYGDDAYVFRPERWLEADKQQLKIMDRNFLAFGAGTRTCLGKNISLLEIFKLVPQLLREFKFELSDPNKPLVLSDHWFVKQTGLICKVQRRPST